MKCKIFLSDEGFGHLVRQRAVFDELIRLKPSLTATVQTGSYADVARSMFRSANLVERFNNIEWAKKIDGSPDLDAIRDFFGDYQIRSDRFIKLEKKSIQDFNFVISDFVYEAFPLAQTANLPVFGVAHFTWDWFFSKMYPSPVSYDIIKRMQQFAKMADIVYFPPFTPRDILSFYGDMAIQTPFIVRKSENNITFKRNGEFNVLIMDSGANVLREHINSAIQQINEIEDMHFLIAERYNIEADNITTIPSSHFFSDYIPHVDLVVTRGGFNTISECIAHRTPILLIGENSNPEIEQNLLSIKHEQLGSFISLERFVFSLKDVLLSFIDHEYGQIKKRMEDHEHETNGAEIIARDILNRVS